MTTSTTNDQRKAANDEDTSLTPPVLSRTERHLPIVAAVVIAGAVFAAMFGLTFSLLGDPTWSLAISVLAGSAAGMKAAGIS